MGFGNIKRIKIFNRCGKKENRKCQKFNFYSDWLDDVNDDDDSATEDSDDDSLNNRLCTFTQTQKEFMNQHW